MRSIKFVRWCISINLWCRQNTFLNHFTVFILVTCFFLSDRGYKIRLRPASALIRLRIVSRRPRHTMFDREGVAVCDTQKKKCRILHNALILKSLFGMKVYRILENSDFAIFEKIWIYLIADDNHFWHFPSKS